MLWEELQKSMDRSSNRHDITEIMLKMAQSIFILGNGQTGGVLVLKNQDHLSPSPVSSTPKSVGMALQQQQKSQPWPQAQQGSPMISSWQQSTKQQHPQQQMVGKQGWQNSQVCFVV